MVPVALILAFSALIIGWLSGRSYSLYEHHSTIHGLAVSFESFVGPLGNQVQTAAETFVCFAIGGC